MDDVKYEFYTSSLPNSDSYLILIKLQLVWWINHITWWLMLYKKKKKKSKFILFMHNNYDFNKNKLIAILSCMQGDA